ncbi:hypothetical protein HYH03_012335 [Edaphochlamys debaryana]|uniref:Uncharacterized protein n=1 Tax=Edaphochlamys debaryana TaxID=47281 RepID=A0A835Y0W2_9CHLO|nr:hypothetical protein HYH03_012335 [Edaphochlamys debaryana]|eukprot:KAG2489109.1 hypothetical protein HYH03_012335 [Edaphochlamys debaryana]
MQLQARSLARTAPPSRRSLVARAFVASEVPPNVKEAREWIEAWRARTGAQHSSAPEPAPGVVPRSHTPPPSEASAAEAPAAPAPAAAPVAAAKPAAAPAPAKPAPKVSADGTITFSASLLSEMKTDDLLKQMNAKAQRK